MAQAGTVWIDVRADTKGFAADLNQAAQGATRSLGGIAASGAKTVLGDIGAAAGTAALGVGALGVAAIKAHSEFDQGMSGVSAVANATSGELDALREAALEAGAATSFSATEAAEAEQELVKAGVSVADVLGGALTGALGLAAAGQLDLGNAATIAAQAMNIFGLEGSEVTHVADVLAAGANKSAADVGQLGDALRQGGLVAAQVGLSFEETAGVLSLFADNALIGSDAGTSLKTMLQRLVPQSEEAANAMADLGLNFFDAEGAFVGIDEVAQQLQTSLGDLSDEQRQNALTTLFGSDAVRGASILMEGGAAAVREYTDAVNDQGAAARMAAEQLNNLKGDLEAFSGSTETALIRIGELFDGTNRALVQGATGFVNVFNDFASTPAWDAVQSNVERLGRDLGGVFDGVGDQLDEFLRGISAAEVDRAFATLTGGIEGAREAVEGLEPIIAGVGLAFSTMALRAIPFVGGLVPALSPLTGLLGGLVLGSEEGRDALESLGEKAADLGRKIAPELGGALSDLAGEVSEGLASALEDVGGAAIDVAEVLGPVLGDAIRDLAPVIGDLIEVGGELVAEVLPILADLAGTILPPAVELLAGGLGIAADAVGFLTDNLELVIPALAAFAVARHADDIAKIGSAFTGVATAAGDMWSAIGDVAATRGVSRLEAFRGVAASTGREVGDLASGLALGLNPAVVGVTVAVVAGASAYLNYADNKRRVAEVSDRLRDALDEEAEAFRRLNEEGTRQTFVDKDALDTVNELGLSLVELNRIAALHGDEVRTLDDLWLDYGENTAAFRRAIEDLPGPVRDVARAVVELNEADVLDDGQVLSFFQALDELAQGTAGSMRDAKAEFESMAREAAAAGSITAGELERVLSLLADADTPDELNRAFNELSRLLGVTGQSAAAAAAEVRGLIDELDELAGVERDVDEQTRRVADAVDDVTKAFQDNGAGISNATEEGRRNADAIQRMVEEHERLAEAQAKIDTTGATSAATLRRSRDALENLARMGLITNEELERLVELFGLADQDIAATVEVDTAKALSDIEDLGRRIGEEITDEAKRAEIQAWYDAGEYDRVRAALNDLAKDEEKKITPTVDTSKVDDEDIGYLFGFEIPADVDLTAANGTMATWRNEVTGELVKAPLDAAPGPAYEALEIWTTDAEGTPVVVPLSADDIEADRIATEWQNKVTGEYTYAPLGANPGEAYKMLGTWVVDAEGTWSYVPVGANMTAAKKAVEDWVLPPKVVIIQPELPRGYKPPTVHIPMIPGVSAPPGGANSGAGRERRRRARGGPVWEDEAFLVGEEGPELGIFPRNGGMVDAQTTERLLSDAMDPDPILAGPLAAPSLTLDPLLSEMQAMRSELAALSEISNLSAAFGDVARAVRDARPINLSTASRDSHESAESLARQMRREARRG